MDKHQDKMIVWASLDPFLCNNFAWFPRIFSAPPDKP